VSLRNRYLAQVTVANGIYIKATYGQIQGDYERLKLCLKLYACVTSSLRLRIFRLLQFCCTECTFDDMLLLHRSAGDRHFAVDKNSSLQCFETEISISLTSTQILKKIVYRPYAECLFLELSRSANG
jgi:hypothetical protein